jgi:diphosphomevalonate decarboxylase
MKSVTVRAPTNIALIKYWGKSDEALIIPLNSSISLTICMTELYTETTITMTETPGVHVTLNGEEAPATSRMTRVIEAMNGSYDGGYTVDTRNTFPTAAGMASSASGFAAFTYALAQLTNFQALDLSIVARLGSGSACRSMLPGIVKWERGDSHTTSRAIQLAPFPTLRIISLVLSSTIKEHGSTDAMANCISSPEMAIRLGHLDERLRMMEEGIVA